MSYDGRSMMGSGIYSQTLSRSLDCNTCQESYDLDTTTDDWGNYEFNCSVCGDLLDSGNLNDDREEARQEALADAWREEW
jgi:transcription initiation factor IIE alpha subunit